jgi:hypothetical protein
MLKKRMPWSACKVEPSAGEASAFRILEAFWRSENDSRSLHAGPQDKTYKQTNNNLKMHA